MTERNEKGQFPVGTSGNLKGKPKGARNKATLASLTLLEGEAETLSRKAIELALEGDTTALRLCLERISPPAKERPLQNIELPNLDNMKSVLLALQSVAHQLAKGELLPSEAKAICNVLDQYQRHYEATELETRLLAIETTLKLR